MLLLIIVAYVIVNSVIYSADVVTTAQNSATSLNEVRLNTHMSLNKTLIGLQPEGLHFSVTNDGNEIIYRLDQMQVYTWDGELANYYTYYNPSVPGNYWDATTGEQGGDGYNGQWIYYPYAPDGPWYNMWWYNPPVLNGEKDVTLVFNVGFPVGTGLMDVAVVRSLPTWTNTSRPPLADDYCGGVGRASDRTSLRP